MWETFSQICINVAVIGAALTYIIKGIKGINKPTEDIKKQFDSVDEKLDNDNRRIKNLEGELDYISNAVSVLMRCDLVILGHMRTNNNTGQMAKMEQEITDFLVNR